MLFKLHVKRIKNKYFRLLFALVINSEKYNFWFKRNENYHQIIKTKTIEILALSLKQKVLQDYFS